jgi:RNA 3'-terminal phosphate cyclase (ATP)
MLVLDGSFGEGGGQIVRTSVSLAALTGKSIRLENIRAGRPKPGLRPQHLTAVRALAQITRAALTGDNIGSAHLTFSPQGIFPGTYLFDVAETTSSAGSVCLVAQTLLPVLLFAQAPSTLLIKGGTHVPWSPPAHYLAEIFLPALKEMGVAADFAIRRWGFYPQGGGEIQLQVNPVQQLQAVEWTTPPNLADFQGLSAAANLPHHVVRRQSQSLRDHLPGPLTIREEHAPSRGQGSFVFLHGPHAGFSALGAKGKPAEKVAGEAAQALQNFLTSKSGVDCHLADQIALYAALASGSSRFTTETVTSHLLTNLWVIEQFLDVKFDLQGRLHEPGMVRGTGYGYKRQTGQG